MERTVDMEGLAKEDFEPVEIHVEEQNGHGEVVTGERPKRRGRKPYPRDADGNIIRPDGSTGAKRRTTTSGRPTVDNRDARKKEIVATLVDINPLICQGMCLVNGIPVQYAMGINLQKGSADFGKTFITPIGAMLVMPDQLIDVYGEAGARFAETPLGLKISDNIGGFTAYAFCLMAVVTTGFWVAGIVRNRGQLKPIIEQMKEQNHPSATDTNQVMDDIFRPEP